MPIKDLSTLRGMIYLASLMVGIALSIWIYLCFIGALGSTVGTPAVMGFLTSSMFATMGLLVAVVTLWLCIPALRLGIVIGFLSGVVVVVEMLLLLALPFIHDLGGVAAIPLIPTILVPIAWYGEHIRYHKEY